MHCVVISMKINVDRETLYSYIHFNKWQIWEKDSH